MSPKRRNFCYLLLFSLIKVLILTLCIVGTFSLFSQLFSDIITPIKFSKDVDIIGGESATEDRRHREYDSRRSHSLSKCQQYEEEITLHTVKMYDLVLS